jgi:hypothetical protein
MKARTPNRVRFMVRILWLDLEFNLPPQQSAQFQS